MLEVTSLSKTFRAPKKKKKEIGKVQDPREDGKWFHAVKNISFSCKDGEVLGLLGINGAGKTTTLRMLATAIKPSEGSAVIDGFDIVSQPMEVKRHIGFLSGNTGLYGRLTAREMVEYYGKLSGVSGPTLKQRMDEVFSLLEMESFLDKRNDNLSTGMKQRVSIARTVIHDPRVLFFDEPTSGLDVLSSESIVAFIKRCKEQGKTVVLSTHFMAEVERLCDKVVVIHHGRIFYDGPVTGMLDQTGTTDMESAFKKLVRGEAAHG